MTSTPLRALARSAQGLALGGVFVAALALGVVLHADLPATRRLVASVANDATSTSFLGRLVIGEVQHLELGAHARARIARVEVFDPEGRRVVLADGVTARIDLARLGASLLEGGALEIALDEARIDGAEVLVDIDANGDLGIARAMSPRPGAPAPPTTTTVKPGSAEDVRLSIPSARLGHAWIHGNVVSPSLDADADDVLARVQIGEHRLSVELAQATMTVRAPRAPGQSSNVHARATGGITVPLSSGPSEASATDGVTPAAPGGGMTMRWAIDGDAAGIPFEAHLALRGDVLDASADIRAPQPDVVRSAFPALPIERPAELHAEAHGKLPSLALTARAQVGGSAIAARGEVTLRAEPAFRVDADLTALDAAAFGGPPSDVSGRVHVEGALAGGAPTGTFRITTAPGTVGAERTPAVGAEGSFDARRVSATLHASEPGVDVAGNVVLSVPEQSVAFDVQARSSSLQSLARAPGVVAGSATARVVGTVDLARATVAARLVADGNDIARAPASVARLHADAQIAGPLTNPVLDITARAEQVRLSAPSEDPTRPKKAPLTYPSATARARVVLAPTPRVLGAEVHVEGAGGDAAIDATASEVVLGPGGVRVRGGRVTGLGAPLAIDVHVQDGALSMRAKGADVDVRRVAAMTGIEELRLLPPGSRATMDIDLRAAAARTDGHIDLTIAGAEDGTAAEIHAKLDGHHISGRARVAVGALGWIEAQRAEIDLPGPLSVSALERATGAVDLRGNIDLSQGAALFAGESVESITGTTWLSARIERLDPRRLPAVYATARTQGLDVVFNGDGTWTHVAGVDAAIHVGYDAATDAAEASVLTWDARGALASAEAKGSVPLFAWATGTKPFDRDQLGALEVAGIADVPRREIGELPGVFARPDLRGGVSLRAVLTGSIARPSARLVARADGLSQAGAAPARASYAPFDGALEARWDGDDVVATLTVDEAERTTPAEARATPDGARNRARTGERKSGHVRGLVIARVPAADLLAGRPPAWNASAELDVADLELSPLPLPMNVRGALTGRVKLRDLTGAPVLESHAHVDDLVIGGVRVMRGDLDLRGKNGSVVARASVAQEDGGTGRVDVTSSALRWRGVDVEWDGARPTRVNYALDRVRLSMLRGFVRRSIPEVDGLIEGRGSATIDAGSQVFEGGLTLSGGRLYVNAIGEEITEISAVASFERDGAFRVRDATARIGAGEVKASATGRMKGLRFEALDIVAVVPSKDGVPLSAEGATFAQVTGEARLSARMAADNKALAVTVTIPRAKVTVPSRGPQTPQSLDPDETIVVGIRQRDGTLAAPAEPPRAARRRREAATKTDSATADGAAPSDDLFARFAVSLGDDIELEGRGVRLYLRGQTRVDLGEGVAVTGQIALREGGTIDAQGHSFVVDRGTVTFVEGDDPANPTVIAAAYWDAPDRTRVWVEFNGPLKTGKLTLRSDPPFSKNEILSILLFGRADPNQARAGDARPSDAQAATDIGAGIASSGLGLNQALGELDENIELEQDRTSANRSRTKVGYRLRSNLKVKIGYAPGFSQREPDTTYVFLEWLFVPKWSLVGTRGDRGTSILDVLFEHRY